MKTIVVLGCGVFHCRVLSVLRKGPYRLVGVDRNPEAPAARLAHEFYAVDIGDAEAIVNLARDVHADAVMPLNEFGMRAHAAAVEELGLLGNTRKSAELAVDKELMRQRWATWNLQQPNFVAFSAQDAEFDSDRIVDLAKANGVSFPCIIKPADSGGSGRGVLILNTADEMAEGVAFASQFARNGRLLLEDFVEGTELTIEGLVQDGEHVILAVSDKEKPSMRTRVATSLNYPAMFEPKVLGRVYTLVNDAVRCLGLTHSATHTECIVTPTGEPFLVELGARGGGGHIFSDIVALVSGVDMPCALADILCGDKPDIRPKRQTGACYRFFNPQPGVLQAVIGLEQAATLPGVVDIGMLKRPGELVGQLLNSFGRTGYVVTSGHDRKEAIERASLVERMVQFVVTPKTQMADTVEST